jgi:putative tricarboxylic transport membrane protein
MARSRAWQAALVRNGWSDALMVGPQFRQFLLAEQARVEAILRRLATDRGTVAPSTLGLTPMTAPLAAAAGLALLLLSIGARLLARRTARPLGTNDTQRSRDDPPRSPWPYALTAALAVQAFAIGFLGFVLTTAVIFAIAARALGSRAAGRDLMIGLAFAGLLYGVFTAGLGLSLPPDPISRVVFSRGW